MLMRLELVYLTQTGQIGHLLASKLLLEIVAKIKKLMKKEGEG